MRAGPIALLFAIIAAMAGPADGGEPAFVGVAACAGCHKAETEAWRGSHHDLAMQEPRRFRRRDLHPR